MDFNDTPEEARFRQEVRTWLEENKIAPWQPGESEIAWSKRWQMIKYKGGWGCPTWPKEWGGRDASTIETMIFTEEEGKVISGPDTQGMNFGIVAPTLIAYMNEADKQRYLPKIASGGERWCQLFSEPSAGSDLAGLITRSVRDGDDWIINGQKIWTSGAQHADFGILVTRSDPDALKHKGLTYFYVDMRSPGIDIRPIKQINGQKNFNEVYLTNVRIPDSQRLGAVGEGWKVALHTLMNERASSGRSRTRQSFDALAMMNLAKETELEDGTALEDRAIREKIADYYVQETGLLYTVARTRTALSKGNTPGPENSIGKLVAAKKTQDMASDCINMLEMSGASMDPDLSPGRGFLQTSYLSAPGSRIAAGTDEILLNIISERVLGLPQEVRVDKEKPFNQIPRGPS